MLRQWIFSSLLIVLVQASTRDNPYQLPLLRNAIGTRGQPNGVLLTPTTRAALRVTVLADTELLSETNGSADKVYAVFSFPHATPVICTLGLSHQVETWADVPLSMERVPRQESRLIGSPDATPARAIRIAEGSDLSILQIPGLSGTAVIGTFTQGDVREGDYVVLYRMRHWHDDVETSHPGAGSCGGHTHRAMTWARVGTL